jgi:L-ascorbate metabolism protein UlaG (beta-lactamase superfamily)
MVRFRLQKKFIVLLAPLMTLLQSCLSVEITRDQACSQDSNDTLQIGDNVTITSFGNVRINGNPFFPSSFRIHADGKVLYIDPLLVDDSVSADVILITHAHPDHFSPEDIKKISEEHTTIIGPASVAKEYSSTRFRVVSPGDTVPIEDIDIQAAHAYSIKKVFLWISAHPRSAENVGYVLTFNGFRVYHAGDTDYVPEMDEISDIDLALLPIGGDNLTMGPEEAAEAVRKMKPRMVIPMHYNPEQSERLDTFLSFMEGGPTEIIIH